MKKRTLLIGIALISFLSSVLEIVMVGESSPHSRWALAMGVAYAITAYWWYFLDKHERNFKAGSLQNIAVAAFTVLGLPIYFFRSRGFGGGAVATLQAFGAFIVLGLIGILGEYAGRAIAG